MTNRKPDQQGHQCHEGALSPGETHPQNLHLGKDKVNPMAAFTCVLIASCPRKAKPHTENTHESLGYDERESISMKTDCVSFVLQITNTEVALTLQESLIEKT